MDPFARKMWAFGFGFGFLLLLLFASLTIVYVHDRPSCPDRVVGETDSPRSTWAATVLERRCGSDAPFVTRVNLRRTGPLERGFFSGQASQGNVFVVEQDAAGTGIRLEWKADDELAVICPRCSPRYVQQQDHNWGPVRISYEFQR